MDLVCYVHPGWEPGFRAAEATREWMDRTPEGFAYRCLPLNIANAHGWEVPCPCGFEAHWNGGPGVADITLRLGPDARPDTAPVSLFGSGVLTFHVFGLIRTPPGWNLWVGGSPNRWKEGIHALTGVIETDWSPYTFTMNWRFTRRNHRVRFERGEPIAFFFPVRRGVLESVRPVYRPLAADPALEAQFHAWRRSRDAFQAEVARNPPREPAARWQKRYYRGVDMADRVGIADHQAKLRLRSFASELDSAAPPAAVDAAEPAAAPIAVRTDTDALGRALHAFAAGWAGGAALETLAAPLVALGLDPAVARRVAAGARDHGAA